MHGKLDLTQNHASMSMQVFYFNENYLWKGERSFLFPKQKLKYKHNLSITHTIQCSNYKELKPKPKHAHEHFPISMNNIYRKEKEFSSKGTSSSLNAKCI